MTAHLAPTLLFLLGTTACYAPELSAGPWADAGTGLESSGPSPGASGTSDQVASAEVETASTTEHASMTSVDPSEASSSDPSSGCGVSVVYRDVDGDGYGDPLETSMACGARGYVEDGNDCDDGDPSVHPGAAEICGAPDLDCDGLPALPCASCLELLDIGVSTDGSYTIDPDGEGELPAEPVWCDMTTDGGGWTLVQRTLWSAAQTDALMTGYDAFLHTTTGGPSPGFVYRLRGDAWPTLAATGEHLLRVDLRAAAAGSSCEPLRYLGTGGEITVSEYGVSIDALDADIPIFSGTELTTVDSGPATSCIDEWNAVPGFYADCCMTCPAFGGEYWDERHPMLYDFVDTVPDLDGKIGADVCPNPAITAALPGVYGANVMEFYVR